MRQLLWSSPLVLLMACASTGEVVAPAGTPSTDGADPSAADLSGSTAREREASAPRSPSAWKQAVQLLQEATRLLDLEDYEGALSLYGQADALGTRIQGVHFYNAAYAAALAGQPDASVEWLRKAIDGGFEDLAHLQDDPDLDAIRQHPGYLAQVARLEAILARQDGPLREELIRMAAEDAEVRNAITPEVRRDPDQLEAIYKRMRAIDEKNTARFKEIIAEKGWPARSRVGRSASGAAWLLVQHADRDPAFQREVLAPLKAAVEQGEADAMSLAYLTDRVLTNEGKPQRYGTQYILFEEKLRPKPVEDMQQLHVLRAEAGMVTLEEYLSFNASVEGLDYSLEPAPLSTLTRP